jgi:hypothetical protein
VTPGLDATREGRGKEVELRYQVHKTKDEVGFSFPIEPGLDEDQVWRATVMPLLEGFPENKIDIWHYCVTEMVNNAIDHSKGSRLMVVVRRRPSNIRVRVLDDGIGIFRKIKTAFNLTVRRALPITNRLRTKRLPKWGRMVSVRYGFPHLAARRRRG